MRSSLRILSTRLSAIHLIPGYELVTAQPGLVRRDSADASILPGPAAGRLSSRNGRRPVFQASGRGGQAINAWFTAATNRRLNEIITPDQIVGDKVDFAVTSAVLFSGRWEDVFDSKETVKAPFHFGGKTFDVAMDATASANRASTRRSTASKCSNAPTGVAPFGPLSASPGISRQLGKVGGVALCRDARSLSRQTRTEPGQCRDPAFRVRLRFPL